MSRRLVAAGPATLGRRCGRFGAGWGTLVHMVGPILIVLTLLIVLPISFFVIGTIISVVLGHTLRKEGEYMNEGSELIELNA